MALRRKQHQTDLYFLRMLCMEFKYPNVLLNHSINLQLHVFQVYENPSGRRHVSRDNVVKSASDEADTVAQRMAEHISEFVGQECFSSAASSASILLTKLFVCIMYM